MRTLRIREVIECAPIFLCEQIFLRKIARKFTRSIFFLENSQLISKKKKLELNITTSATYYEKCFKKSKFSVIHTVFIYIYIYIFF